MRKLDVVAPRKASAWTCGGRGQHLGKVPWPLMSGRLLFGRSCGVAGATAGSHRGRGRLRAESLGSWESEVPARGWLSYDNLYKSHHYPFGTRRVRGWAGECAASSHTLGSRVTLWVTSGCTIRSDHCSTTSPLPSSIDSFLR